MEIGKSGSCTIIVSMVIYHVLVFFLKQLASGQYLVKSKYQWTQYAKIKLRKHDELPHVTKNRLRSSAEFAESAIHCYPDHNTGYLIRILTFPVSCMVGLIFFLTLGDIGLLFNIEILHYSLLAWLTILVSISYVCRHLTSAMNNRPSIHQLTPSLKLDLINGLQEYGLTHFKHGFTREIDDDKRIFVIAENAKLLYKHTFICCLEQVVSILRLPWLTIQCP